MTARYPRPTATQRTATATANPCCCPLPILAAAAPEYLIVGDLLGADGIDIVALPAVMFDMPVSVRIADVVVSMPIVSAGAMLVVMLPMSLLAMARLVAGGGMSVVLVSATVTDVLAGMMVVPMSPMLGAIGAQAVAPRRSP